MRTLFYQFGRKYLNDNMIHNALKMNDHVNNILFLL